MAHAAAVSNIPNSAPSVPYLVHVEVVQEFQGDAMKPIRILANSRGYWNMTP